MRRTLSHWHIRHGERVAWRYSLPSAPAMAAHLAASACYAQAAAIGKHPLLATQRARAAFLSLEQLIVATTRSLHRVARSG